MSITDEHADKLYRELYQRDKEIRRLRSALEPFALVVPFDFAADNEPVLMRIKASAFRQARAALEAKE